MEKDDGILQLQQETRAPKLISNRSDLNLLEQDSSDELEASCEYNACTTRYKKNKWVRRSVVVTLLQEGYTKCD